MTDTTSTPILIEHEESNGHGAFFVAGDDRRLAEMAYRRKDPHLVVIVHTEVDDALRGQGVGRKLLDATVAWARETGTKLAATCPYVKAQFEKDRSLDDVHAS